jgi:hypothetical protein
MSQRDSGYERKERDLYETPTWVTWALLPHLPWRPKRIWEPACGGGKMGNALVMAQFEVVASDIDHGVNFLNESHAHSSDAIITNPPYRFAEKFVAHAINLIAPDEGMVAMLLRVDFDSANTRRNLFKWQPAFAKKVVLTKRIRWFEGSKGSPSFNHAWFIWDWKHKGPPTLAYGP